MIGILPGRLATRQRLIVGAILIAGTSLLHLIPLELGPFGSPWPIALLWGVCGWAGLGPNAAVSFLLFVLGLWVDVLIGATLGTWAAIALISYVFLILLARYVGTSSLGRLGKGVLGGVVMYVIMVGVGFWRGGSFYLLGALLPLVAAVILYHFIGGLFELAEDAT